MSNKYKLVECPRDAMQGIKEFIPTEFKINYLNLLLKVGFDTLDFGSFVSPKAIPQMADTKDVLAGLDFSDTDTKLLAIVANTRGAKEACEYEKIDFLGFPFSISETFQQRNTNSGINESIKTVKEIVTLCKTADKQAVVYLSMAFGNPYGDEWSYELVEKYARILVEEGVEIISAADTVGTSTPNQIKELLPRLIDTFKQTEIGIHLHTTLAESDLKIAAVYQSGCLRIDSALRGFGGCPMAADKLTGNLATENILSFLNATGEQLPLDLNYWEKAMNYSKNIFG